MRQKYYTVIGKNKKDGTKKTFYKWYMTENEAMDIVKDKKKLYENVLLWIVCAPRDHKVLKIN